MPRGRKRGFVMSDEHRVKIQNSNILNALIEHVNGDREMTASQVTAGVALMKKVMPDLQSMELTGDADNPVHVKSLNDFYANSITTLNGTANAQPEPERLLANGHHASGAPGKEPGS